MTEDRGPKTDEVAIRSMHDHTVPGETCDHCGEQTLRWRKCKLICDSCGNIMKSCADL